MAILAMPEHGRDARGTFMPRRSKAQYLISYYAQP